MSLDFSLISIVLTAWKNPFLFFIEPNPTQPVINLLLHFYLYWFRLAALLYLPVLPPILKYKIPMDRKPVLLILVFLAPSRVPGTQSIPNKRVEWMNVYFRMKGTKPQLGIFHNSVFSTLTEIDLQWNVDYLAAEFRLGGEPRKGYTSQMVIWKRKLIQRACLAI